MTHLKNFSLVLSIAFISPLALLPATGILGASAAWAETSMSSSDSSDDSSNDPSQQEDVRSSTSETCNDVASSTLAISRC